MLLFDLEQFPGVKKGERKVDLERRIWISQYDVVWGREFYTSPRHPEKDIHEMYSFGHF
jgi:hypothetical protein